MESILPPASALHPDVVQDLDKLKKLRSNVVVMEQEHRKLKETLIKNLKEKNEKLSMVEQVLRLIKICLTKFINLE